MFLEIHLEQIENEKDLKKELFKSLQLENAI
jgi:hypothetical protein